MEIGEHCSLSSCNRLDFLPFMCDYCKQIFCSDHHSTDAHNCNDIPQKVTIATSSGSDVQCSLAKCGVIKMVEYSITCPYCSQLYCLKHRDPSEHYCDKMPSKSTSAARPPYKATTPVRPQGPSSVSLSNKVSLMKLKLKAQPLGSIPEVDRIYLNVILPKEYNEITHPVYLSKQWTVGKCVDSITNKYKIRNTNDKPGADKIVLMNDDTQLPMGQEIQSVACSGQSLQLVYIKS